jgi:aspartyl-tRNA(Asn)/glutamyl-tRNA(Gln) amidotransferase subunit C
MANFITKDEVLHIADVARLQITEEEADKLTSDLEAILKHAAILQEVDTTDVKPTTHVLELVNVMRDDVPKETATQEEVLKNAPDYKDGEFRVPSILSE